MQRRTRTRHQRKPYSTTRRVRSVAEVLAKIQPRKTHKMIKNDRRRKTRRRKTTPRWRTTRRRCSGIRRSDGDGRWRDAEQHQSTYEITLAKDAEGGHCAGGERREGRRGGEEEVSGTH